MKSVLVFLLVVWVYNSFGQSRYFIYFTDKGISPDVRLSKSMPEYDEVLSSLSEKAVQRRLKHSEDGIIITYEDLPLKNEYKSTLESAGIKIYREITWLNAVSAYLSAEEITFVSGLPFVKSVEPVRLFKFRYPDIENNLFYKAAADDLNYGDSFTQLALSDIPAVHSKGITGEGVIVGLLDTGYDWRDHEALVDANVLAEYDFIFNDNITADEPEDIPGQHAHGTAVMSVIAGYKDSTLIGSAFNAAYLLAKTEDIRSETTLEEDNYAAALIWMENLGVDITSSSLGYNEFDNSSYSYSDMDGETTVVTRALNIAFQKGIVTVTAAGNEGNTHWRHIIAPADAFNVISIGSVTSENKVAASSGRGPTADGRIKPEVTAMGVSVLVASHISFNAYGLSGGTSLATPIASGAAALLLSAYPHLKNTQVRSIILETAGNSTSPDNDRGYGLISAADAISYPNIEETAGGTIIHKMFFAESAVDPSSVKIFYASGNDNFIEGNLELNGNVYNFNASSVSSGAGIHFYYTYNDSTGNEFRVPQQNSYRFTKGTLLVNLNLNNIPLNYVLGQNYPNPFNTSTRIDFIAPANERAELFVVDAAGQKVKVLFNGIAQQGVNTVLWDGTSDRGYQCASGVYLYFLKLGGNDYGKKMVLLK